MRATYDLILAVFILALISGCVSDHPVLEVKVEGGRVQGVAEGGITVFRGIPFAAPPVGDLRWKAPQPVIPWDTVLRAVKFAPACPQIAFGAKPETSEDCLYLNIWTPAKSQNEKLPVMVWIHGGGFALGSTSTPMYSGERIAGMGVILVSIAYRLGPLGFLVHPELSAESPQHISGNYGLLDQIAALRWVQNNIATFGGDPAKVTIFGESAGAEAVSMLCASPLAKGLFRGAISESGGSFGPVKLKSRGEGMQFMKGAEQTGVAFASRMGVSSLAEMRKLSPDKWLNDPLSQMGGCWPVVDGYVITGDQYKLYEAGRYNDVNVIIGTNSDEGAIFVQGTTPAKYAEAIRYRFGPFAERVLKSYPGNTEAETFTSSCDIFRETVFAWPSWAWARLQSRTGKSKVYVYYFDQQQPNSVFSPLKPRGAAHAAEISYIFRHIDLSPQSQFTEEDRQLSEKMSQYWTNFAKTGDPNGTGLPEWPVFSETKPLVMYLNNNLQPGPVPNLDKLQLMEEYFKFRRDEME